MSESMVRVINIGLILVVVALIVVTVSVNRRIQRQPLGTGQPAVIFEGRAQAHAE